MSEKTRKLPAFQFYPADWKSDLGVRVSSLEARGLWIELMCLMHHGTPYGHLTINGIPIEDKNIWKLVAGSPNETKRSLKELEEHNVFSRDSKGIIFCRRMVRDAADRELNRQSGATGGNPNLTFNYNKPGYLYAIQRSSDNGIKIGIAINPTHRLYKLRRKFNSEELTLLRHWSVTDMGLSESNAHRLFDDKRIVGEWFKLNDNDLLTLESTLKGRAKDSTPSSSAVAVAVAVSKDVDVELPPHTPHGGVLASPSNSPAKKNGRRADKTNPRARGTNKRAVLLKQRKATEAIKQKLWHAEDSEESDAERKKRAAMVREKMAKILKKKAGHAISEKA